MDNNEAIGILRGDISPASVLHRGIAEKMSAEALRAWAWVERGQQAISLSNERGRWEGTAKGLIIGYGPTPLAAVLDAMEKEKDNEAA